MAIGKKKGLLTTGAIVMFLLDENGTIVEGTRLTGITVLSRFRAFPDFDGLALASIDASRDRRFTRSIRLAVDNSRDNYRWWMTGQTPQDPPGPLSQIADGLRKLAGRPSRNRPIARVLAEVAAAPGIPGSAKQRITLPKPR